MSISPHFKHFLPLQTQLLKYSRNMSRSSFQGCSAACDIQGNKKSALSCTQGRIFQGHHQWALSLKTGNRLLDRLKMNVSFNLPRFVVCHEPSISTAQNGIKVQNKKRLDYGHGLKIIKKRLWRI